MKEFSSCKSVIGWTGWKKSFVSFKLNNSSSCFLCICGKYVYMCTCLHVYGYMSAQVHMCRGLMLTSIIFSIIIQHQNCGSISHWSRSTLNNSSTQPGLCMSCHYVLRTWVACKKTVSFTLMWLLNLSLVLSLLIFLQLSQLIHNVKS